MTSNFIAPGNQSVYIFVIKLPIILADLVMAAMLLRTAGQLRLGRSLALLYLLNPYVLTVGVIWGMMDNLVSVLLIASMLALNAKRPSWSGCFAASAVALKLYPVLFIPLMVAFLVRDRHIRRLIAYAISFIMTCFLTIVSPFLIFGWKSVGFMGVGVSQLARSPGAIAP
jgi:Gpi18-like mannosyltransferase